MKKIFIIVLSVLSLTLLNSQTPEKWTLYVFVGTYGEATVSGDDITPDEDATPGTKLFPSELSGYSGDKYGLPLIRTEETQEGAEWPLVFSIPDQDNPNVIIGIHDYLTKYGEPYGNEGHKQICYLDFLSEAIPAYWKSMFKNTTGNVDSDLELVFVWPPDATTDKEMWVVPDTGDYKKRMYNFENVLKNTLPVGEFDSYQNRTMKKSILLMLPEFSGIGCWGFANYIGGLRTYAYWRPQVLNQTSNVIAHELGHSIPAFKDQGNEGAGGTQYSGRIDGEMMGQTFSTSGIYDVMHSSGTLYSPSLLYGIMPFCTQDLLNTSGVIIKDKLIEENTENNKTSLTLKAIREPLTNLEYIDERICETVSLPINTDTAEADELNGSMVGTQKLLIEYRNGKGFDDYTAMFQEPNSSRGILISHIIGYNTNRRMVDIEIATPFPEFQEDGITPYRDPNNAWPQESGKNGMWYFGKKINDWQDDYAPDAMNHYEWEGGKSTWYMHTNKNNQSLPTDFFNDTDLNKFTPVTRPNTNSWKGAETNIGVFVDKIEGDYAYLTIYRNYFSNPFTMGTKGPDKSNILEIKGDGYIGENFYVDDGLSLNIGEADNPGKTTVIPNTNMSVRNESWLNVQNDSKLRLENSIISMQSGSYFRPYASTILELDNSHLSFESDSYFETMYLSDIDISLNSSSLTCKDMELKGLVNLDLSNSSKLNFYADTNLKLTGESNISIEEGSQLIFGIGSTISIEGTSMLHGDIMTKNVALLELKENSNLNLCPSTDLNILAGTTLKLGKNSKIVLENGSNFVLDDGAVVELEEGAEIVILNKGTLTTKNLTSDRVTFTAPTGQWKGITCEVGSTVNIDGANISGAETAILGTPFGCTIKNSSIYNCANAVELINCNNYLIENNVMTGNDSGFAVRLATSNGAVKDNTLKNFSYGLVVILCSPEITKNLIRDNVMNGIYINGNNAYPYLVDDLENDIIVNNEVVANGINTYDEKNAQIRMVYPSNAYMYYGMNNIYYHQNAPAIYAQSNLVVNDQIKSLTNPVVRVSAQYNYWGASEITSENSSDIFDLWRTLYEGYSVTYTDYATKPFPDDGLPITTLYGDMTLEAKMLAQAIKAENDGRIDLAIKKYEKLIDKFPDSEENYIAVIRLTDVLAEKEEPLDQLMALYDENIVSGDDTTNKRFYKEMKVAASIKSKKYDDAITLAEDLKAQAQTDNDVVLAELDIAIAKMMKTAENNNKGAKVNFADISSLTDKISGGNNGSQLTGITEGIVPKESKLYQNYPNPFNPVTQIRFDLARTEEVKLSVYNVSGQLVSELVNGVVNAGCHSIEFDGSKLNSGVYYYTLSTKGETATQKMILTK